MYNYLEAIKSDIKDYIENEVNTSNYSDREELENDLNDTLWTVDSVTGNASGSYTQYCPSLDYLDGWLYGAVQAVNGIMKPVNK